MSNPLSKDDPITTKRMLSLIKQVFDCIEQDGTGAMPVSRITTDKSMVIKFEDGEEFQIYIHETKDLQ